MPAAAPPNPNFAGLTSVLDNEKTFPEDNYRKSDPEDAKIITMRNEFPERTSRIYIKIKNVKDNKWVKGNLIRKTDEMGKLDFYYIAIDNIAFKISKDELDRLLPKYEIRLNEQWRGGKHTTRRGKKASQRKQRTLRKQRKQRTLRKQCKQRK